MLLDNPQASCLPQLTMTSSFLVYHTNMTSQSIVSISFISLYTLIRLPLSLLSLNVGKSFYFYAILWEK